MGLGCRTKPLQKLNASPKKKVTFDVNVKTYEPEEVVDFQPEKTEEKRPSVETNSEESSVTSTGSYPTNHRYHNCTCIDDEDAAMEYWDSDLTDEDEDEDEDDSDMGEEYDEVGEDFEDGTVYSRSRNGDNEGVVAEVESPIPVKSIGLNRNVRDRSVYVHSVLNPVENLTQWKAVKAKRAPALVSQKENLVLNQESRAAFGADSESPKKLNREIAVDASLSNWLGSSETTPVSSHGSNTLSVEEIKQFSASCSPRKSPRDEIAIIGSVGSYWNCGGYAQDSGSANRVTSRRVQYN